MSLIKRVWFAIKVTITMGLTAIIHFRIGVDHLYPMAHTYSGPFTQYADAIEQIIPIAIGIAMLATWLWVVYGSVTEEKKRAVRVR